MLRRGNIARKSSGILAAMVGFAEQMGTLPVYESAGACVVHCAVETAECPIGLCADADSQPDAGGAPERTNLGRVPVVQPTG
jgi:hypothetical protein